MEQFLPTEIKSILEHIISYLNLQDVKMESSNKIIFAKHVQHNVKHAIYRLLNAQVVYQICSC